MGLSIGRCVGLFCLFVCFFNFQLHNPCDKTLPCAVFFLLAYDEYEVSPYEELELNLVRNIEMSRMASIMAGTATNI